MRQMVNGRVVDVPTDSNGALDSDALRTAAAIPAVVALGLLASPKQRILRLAAGLVFLGVGGYSDSTSCSRSCIAITTAEIPTSRSAVIRSTPIWLAASRSCSGFS